MDMEVSKHAFSLKNDLPDYYNTARKTPDSNIEIPGKEPHSVG
jgi:hypothetical protein